MMKNRVCIIACYMGKLPEWMPLWLLSCKENHDFVFLLITDRKVNDLPENVKNIVLSMEELRQRFSDCLGFEAVLQDAYKLCDYRPLFGKAFAKELEGFDFWGHCDLDIIFGRLDEYINDDVLSGFERIGQCGHLMLYRNNERINTLYERSGSAFPYTVVFRDATHYGFDEMTGMNLILKTAGIPFYYNYPVADCSRFLSRLTNRPMFDGNEFFCWINGRIYRVFEFNNSLMISNFAYIHFQKKRPSVVGEGHEHGFYIRSNELVPRMEGDFTLEELERESEFVSVEKDKHEFEEGKKKRILDLLFREPLHRKRILLHKAIVAKRNGLWL